MRCQRLTQISLGLWRLSSSLCEFKLVRSNYRAYRNTHHSFDWKLLIVQTDRTAFRKFYRRIAYNIADVSRLMSAIGCVT